MKKNINRLLALLLIVLIGLLSVDTKQMTVNAFEERTEISQNETIEEAVNGEVVLDSAGKVEGEVKEDTNEEEILEGGSVEEQDAENQDEENVDIENQDTEDANVEARGEGEELEDSTEGTETQELETVNSKPSGAELVQEDSVNYEDTELNTEDTDARASTGRWFDLRNAFQSSGMLMSRDMSKSVKLDSSHYGAYYQYPERTRIRIGMRDVTYPRQTIMLTSKYSLDFKAKFVIEGSLGMGIGPDGLAFAFHREKNFQAVNTSGSLGVYYDPKYPSSNKPEGGLKNAFIFEVDPFYNSGGAFGDNMGSQRHMDVVETNGSGSYYQRLEYWVAPDGLFTKFTNPNSTQRTRFIITWSPQEQRLKIEFPDLNLSGFKNINSAVLNEYSRWDIPVYFSVAASLDTWNSLSHPVDIEITRIEYADLEPEISTKILNKDGTKEIKEALPGEIITVEHIFRNGNKNYQSDIKNKDVNFLSLDIVSSSNNSNIGLQTMNIKKWEHSIGGNPDRQAAFDVNNPLKVNFLSYNRPYIVRYQVKIPESIDKKENYGVTHQLKFKYLFGQQGMTQYYLEGELPILIRPNISSERPTADVDTVDEYEVYKVNVTNNANEIEKTKIMQQLWDKLYVQPAGQDKEQLIMGQDGKNVTVQVTYYLNGTQKTFKDIPNMIPKGSSISMCIKATDKSNPNLVCYYNRTIVFADHMSRNEQYVLYANNLPEMKETKLNTLTVEVFKKLVQTDSKAIGLKKNDDKTISSIGLTVNPMGEVYQNMMDMSGRDQPYEQEIAITESANTKVKPTLKVTSNTIGVDDGVNNPDGDTAYVIIPKNITLVDKKGSQDISGSAKVFIPDYETNKKFDVYVPKSIQIINKNNKKTININTSGGTEEGQERKIGTLNSAKKELTFNLSGNRDKTAQSGEVWNGKITFRVKAYR